jgi:hypothetical protein
VKVFMEAAAALSSEVDGNSAGAQMMDARLRYAEEKIMAQVRAEQLEKASERCKIEMCELMMPLRLPKTGAEGCRIANCESGIAYTTASNSASKSAARVTQCMYKGIRRLGKQSSPQ